MKREPTSMAKTILQAHLTGREVARQIAEGITLKVEVKPVVEIRPTPTEVIDLRNVNVNGTFTPLIENGYGNLKEFMLKAENPNYEVKLYRDKKRIIRGSHAYYAEISQQIEEVDAFEDNGNYILKLNDIEFAESIEVIIETTEPITFTSIFAKYKLSRELGAEPSL